MEIEELCDANIYELIPEFVKAPLPAITLLGGSASFCTRITPIESDVVWSVCGREISEDMKEYKVSGFFLDFTFICLPLPHDQRRIVNRDDGKWKNNQS